MRILAVADVPSDRFYEYYTEGKLDEFDLILSCGDLRPEYLERANVFTWILKFIYNFDTPTNVFPSEHAVGTTAALLALWDCGYMKRHRLGGCLFLLWGALIIASTALTKQHALIDLPAGILLALTGGAFVYRKRLKGTAPVSF